MQSTGSSPNNFLQVEKLARFNCMEWGILEKSGLKYNKG
jgi:hypothetical protein